MRVTSLLLVIIIVGGGAYYAWKKGYFGQAEQAVDTSFSVHLANGKRLYQKTNYEEAIKELEKAMELEPNHPDMPRAMGRVPKVGGNSGSARPT